MYLNAATVEKQERQKSICNKFSEFLLTDKLWHYLRMNTTLY